MFGMLFYILILIKFQYSFILSCTLLEYEIQ
jgi:hypothetical protein